MAGLVDNFRIQLPFADRGDKVGIPQVDITTNFVNMDMGYTIDYEREIGKDDNAKAVERRKQNWLFNLMTANIKQWQEQGFPQWYKAVQYSEGSCVRYVSYTDPSGNVVGDDKMYRCLSSSVPVGMRPNGDGASSTWWERIPSVGEILDSIPMPAGGGIPSRELISATTGIDFNNPATLGGNRSSGTWELATDAVAAAAANVPSNKCGMLEMKQWTGGGKTLRIQRYTDYTGACYYRSYGGANWTTWSTWVTAATTLAGYGIQDAVSSTQNRAANLVPDASSVDLRWASTPISGMTVAKVAAVGIPAPFWWRFTGSTTGTNGGQVRLAVGSTINGSFPVEGGSWYDVSCWVRHSTGSTFGGGILLDWYNGSTRLYTTSVTSQVGPTTPRDTPIKITGMMQAPANATACIVVYARTGVDASSAISGEFMVGAAYMEPSTRSATVRIEGTSGLDFNSYTSANVYEFTTDAGVGSAANRPHSSARAGTLYVNQISAAIITQVYVDRTGFTWTRGWSNAWSPWQKTITDVGNQSINGELYVSGAIATNGRAVEVGNQTGSAGSANVDFHTDGTNADWNARIEVPTNSSDINLRAYKAGAAASGTVRILAPNSKALALLSVGSSASDITARAWGSAGRANVLEFGDSTSYMAYLQRKTAGGTDVELSVNGDINARSSATSGVTSANGELITNGTQLRINSGGPRGLIIRNDGNSTYLLVTNDNDKFGNYNALRPFYFNNQTGGVTMGNGVQVSGGVTINTGGLGVGVVAGGLGNAGIAIGDSDTGFKWVSDGVFDIMANAAAIGRVNTSGLTINRAMSVANDLVGYGPIIKNTGSGWPGAGAYANQYTNAAAPFVTTTFAWNPQNGGTYFPIVKGMQSRIGQGYGTAVSFGFLAPTDAGWPQAQIHMRGDNGTDRAWTFNMSDGSFTTAGNIIAHGGQLRCGTNTIVAADGNIFGSQWGNQWLRQFLDATYTKQVRMGANIAGPQWGSGGGTVPAGCVLTGGNFDDDQSWPEYAYVQYNVNGTWINAGRG